jgi:RimJ/RimL family protein N-acetyltransferase
MVVQYDETLKSDDNRKRQRDLGREHLAIMHGIVPVGEVILKNIDPNQRCCTLGIHLRNSVKNKGYGTAAEILALQYAFHKLQCETVYTDAIHKNL